MIIVHELMRSSTTLRARARLISSNCNGGQTRQASRASASANKQAARQAVRRAKSEESARQGVQGGCRATNRGRTSARHVVTSSRRGSDRRNQIVTTRESQLDRERLAERKKLLQCAPRHLARSTRNA